MTDYAIARRIVDLHSRNEESVDRVYCVEDIMRYLMFARQFKPKVSAGLLDQPLSPYVVCRYSMFSKSGFQFSFIGYN